MLNLSRVTLCCVDCVNHDLALAAIEQCVQKCAFGRVLFITDRVFEIDGIDVVRIAPLASRGAYSHYVIKELVRHIDTEFVLMVQWDGFVLKAASWSDTFSGIRLRGRRWGWHEDGHAVGNGGFSLRSRRLLEALADPHIAEFPIEDEAICRTYRTYLEATHGIRFAPRRWPTSFHSRRRIQNRFRSVFMACSISGFFFQKPDIVAFLEMTTPAILGSLQCMQLAKNLAAVKRTDESGMMLRRISGRASGAHGSCHAARDAEPGPRPFRSPRRPRRPWPATRAVGRNDPCPCGSGKRYKDCHGKIG